MNFKRDAYMQLIFFLPIISALVLSIPLMLYGPIGTISFIFLIIGGILIFSSKWKLKIKTKIPFEWGSIGMSARETFIYRIGYLIMFFGILIAILGIVGVI